MNETPKQTLPRLVVGVGASAGGLEAFKQLLAALPHETGMSFLLVQHLDPTHKSMLPELLSACTEMTVTDAGQGVELRADAVYIIRPDTALAVRQGKIELSAPTLHFGVRLPVDHLFRSLAREYGPRAAGIVLSGAGSDGNAGLRDIKAAGGLTIAQQPDSSGQLSMPQSAIDNGVVDLVLQINEIPAALERFASLPPRARIELAAEEAYHEPLERLSSLKQQELARLAVMMRERRHSVIAGIALHALQQADLQNFMEQAVRDVHQTLDTDYCKILELQPGGTTLLVRAGVGWVSGIVGSAYVQAGPESQAGYTLQSLEPVIVDDLSTEKRFVGSPLLVEHEVTSGLSCVIRDSDHQYGVLSVHTKRHRSFMREDANFLQAVASVIGSTISRNETRLRLALERGITQVLAESATLDEALSKLLERMAIETSASVGEVWWSANGGHRLTCRLRFVMPHEDKDHVNDRFGRHSFESGKGLVGRVFEENRAAWCTDLGDPTLFVRRDGAKALGLVSGFGIPVCVGKDVVGVVTLFSRKRLFADDIFLRGLEGIGRSIGEFMLRTRLEERAYRLAAITESSHDAILSYNYGGTVTEWLAGAERLFGYSAEEMLGNSIERIVPEEERQKLWSVNERIRCGDIVEPFDATRLRSDGTRVEVSVRSSPVKDRDGNIVGISSTDRDITRQKETERRLVEADQQKDEFLAMLGHELRNPLAAIQNASEVIKLMCSSDSRLERAQTILERQTIQMGKLLDGLLDVSRIVRGTIKLDFRVVSLTRVCRELLSDQLEFMSERKLEVVIHLPRDPIWVEGDPVRLNQIIDNLISNAVKYTPEDGSITFALEREDGQATLRVRDTGVGIESELLPHIFDVFRQSKQSLDRSCGGLGLGLALVKSLVELHGGSIEAKSQGKNRGAEFVVRIPITGKAPEGTAETAGRVARPLRILVIEDNEDVAKMTQALLEMSGHQVLIASRGAESVAIAKEHRPDVILCDLGLPDGMSGFDVAREIRAVPGLQGVRLVALSGYGRPEDRARGMEAGFDAHITKPVDANMLERILVEAGSRKEGST